MKCCIIKELLPNYIDGLTSEEANEEIRKHLESCEDCRRICEQMSADIPRRMTETENEVDFLKKLRGRLRLRYAAVAALTCAVLAGLTFFAKKYGTPIPYDSDCMTIETYQAAGVVNEFGMTQWKDVDGLDFETSGLVMEGEGEIIPLVQFVITEPAVWDDFRSVGRTVKRDGEEVRVVYSCYTRTLWNRMFPNSQAYPCRMVSSGDIYGLRLYHAEYEPVMTELYYLPMSSQWQLDRLSDEEFDSQREDAILMWSGMN